MYCKCLTLIYRYYSIIVDGLCGLLDRRAFRVTESSSIYLQIAFVFCLCEALIGLCMYLLCDFVLIFKLLPGVAIVCLFVCVCVCVLLYYLIAFRLYLNWYCGFSVVLLLFKIY